MSDEKTTRIKYAGTAKDEALPQTIAGLVPGPPLELGTPAEQRAGIDVTPEVAHILTGEYGFKLVEEKGTKGKPKTIDELAAEMQKARAEKAEPPAAPPVTTGEGAGEKE